jgi:hypothetical protein
MYKVGFLALKKHQSQAYKPKKQKHNQNDPA